MHSLARRQLSQLFGAGFLRSNILHVGRRRTQLDARRRSGRISTPPFRPGAGGWTGLFLGMLLLTGGASQATPPAFVAGQILVKPKAHLADSDFNALLRSYSSTEKNHLREINVRVIAVPEAQAER